jgi:hypothetical protein
LFDAPEGWPPPTAPDNWNPPVNSIKGEPAFNEVDIPGCQSLFTFQILFEPRGGKYIYHAMPAVACPIPANGDMRKREVGGYEFFYNGWKQDNPMQENCQFGETRDTLFPPDRQVQLDATYLKKIGLTRQRMLECDTMFFYQLLLPIDIVDPKCLE